jgi:predicted  nucleic acid-binding Zn-ribbon protein
MESMKPKKRQLPKAITDLQEKQSQICKELGTANEKVAELKRQLEECQKELQHRINNL